MVGFERYADLAQNLHDVLGEAAGATQTAVQVCVWGGREGGAPLQGMARHFH